MTRVAGVFLLMIILTAGLLLFLDTKTSSPKQTTMGPFTLRSSAFTNNGSIPSRYTCDESASVGEINPPLEISGAPENAKSLAIIMDDPDVPKSIRADGLWVHWVRFNIPPETTAIPEGSEPQGLAGKGTAGNTTYHGPCPPDREHRYFFKLYALDAMFNLPEGASKSQLEEAMKGHIIKSVELVGRYNRIGR